MFNLKARNELVEQRLRARAVWLEMDNPLMFATIPQIDGKIIRWQPISGALGPFDHTHTMAIKRIFQANPGDCGCIFNPVQINMVDRRIPMGRASAVLIDQHKAWAVDHINGAEALGNAFGEMRFARTKIAIQQNNIANTQQLAKPQPNTNRLFRATRNDFTHI